MARVVWSGGLEEVDGKMSIILCADVIGIEVKMRLIDRTRARLSTTPRRIEQVLVCMVRELQEEVNYECDVIDMCDMGFRGKARLN